MYKISKKIKKFISSHPEITVLQYDKSNKIPIVKTDDYEKTQETSMTPTGTKN